MISCAREYVLRAGAGAGARMRACARECVWMRACMRAWGRECGRVYACELANAWQLFGIILLDIFSKSDVRDSSNVMSKLGLTLVVFVVP